MVKRRNTKFVLLALTSALFLSSCSPSKFWGEEAPPAKVVEQVKSESNCPSVEKILKGTEGESARVLECLKKDVNDAWEKIRGSDRNTLTQQEIDVLINKGIVDLSEGDSALTKRKVHGIKRLLGIQGSATKEKTDHILAWVEKYRGEIRQIYSKVQNHEYFSYDDVKTGAKILASFFRGTDWKIDHSEFGAILTDLIDNGASDSAIPEFGLVLFDALGALCPGLAEVAHWEGSILAECAVNLTNHLEPGAAWFEFYFNPVDKNFKPAKISESLDNLVVAIEHWTGQESLQSMHPRLWVAMAKKLKAEPPKNFLKSLNIIKKVHPLSDGENIHPGAIAQFFKVIQNHHRTLSEGMVEYINAHNNGRCVNETPKSWMECELSVNNDLLSTNSAIGMAARVRNTNHGVKALPFNGANFRRTSLFHALAKQIVDSFDTDRDGFVSSDFSTDSDDEVMELLSTTLNSIDVISRFVENVQTRVEGRLVQEQPPFSSFAHLNMKGMARLVTMTGSDILGRRAPKKKSFFRGLFDNLFNTFPVNSVKLDRDAITSILVLVDSFGDYRNAYTSSTDGESLHSGGPRAKRFDRYNRRLMDRDVILGKLPEILKLHFPRTYRSCVESGFARSCGITFDEILPTPDDGSKLIAASNLDLITLVASAMEGVVDNCDLDKNERLGWSVFDGSDELDCAFTKFSGIARRLMESKIVAVEGEAQVTASLSLINSVFVTRAFAKVALMDGSYKGIVAAPITLWFHEDASIGSIYSLMSEILANSKVKALEALGQGR